MDSGVCVISFMRFKTLITAATNWREKPMEPLLGSMKQLSNLPTPKAKPICTSVWSNMNEPAKLSEHAIERDDQLMCCSACFSETLPLCSGSGRLRTVEGVRSDLTLILSLIEEVDDEKLPKLLQPIRSPIDDIFVPFRQVDRFIAHCLSYCLNRPRGRLRAGLAS